MDSGLNSRDHFRLVGKTFDSTYAVERVIGEGSFGVVYEARHVQLRKTCALKVLKLEGAQDPHVVIERFWREARASAALKHAGAIDVHDARVEQSSGRLYYVMDLLRGISLFTRWLSCEGRRMPPVEALGCIRQVAGCMSVAHGAGIVHRDLKPENIFLCRDHDVKVLDFGCVLIKQEPRLTRPGWQIGPPHYTPPEQLDLVRTTPDPRADIYALGVTLYHVLSGHWVYPPHPEPVVVRKAVLTGPPRDIAAVAPDLPKELHALIRKAIARNSEDRFQTMRELEAAISVLLRSGVVPLRVGPDASTLAKTAPRPRPIVDRSAVSRFLGRITAETLRERAALGLDDGIVAEPSIPRRTERLSPIAPSSRSPSAVRKASPKRSRGGLVKLSTVGVLVLCVCVAVFAKLGRRWSSRVRPAPSFRAAQSVTVPNDIEPTLPGQRVAPSAIRHMEPAAPATNRNVEPVRQPTQVRLSQSRSNAPKTHRAKAQAIDSAETAPPRRLVPRHDANDLPAPKRNSNDLQDPFAHDIEN